MSGAGVDRTEARGYPRTVGVVRRVGEPAAPGRGVRRSVQGAVPDSPAARLLWLPASAGNQAVTGLLGVQRDPDPAPEPAVAERIAEARGQVTRGEIDAPAFEHYRTSSAGTVAEVVGLLWLNELTLVEVDPSGAGIAERADKKLVTDFKIGRASCREREWRTGGGVTVHE